MGITLMIFALGVICFLFFSIFKSSPGSQRPAVVLPPEPVKLSGCEKLGLLLEQEDDRNILTTSFPSCSPVYDSQDNFMGFLAENELDSIQNQTLVSDGDFEEKSLVKLSMKRYGILKIKSRQFRKIRFVEWSKRKRTGVVELMHNPEHRQKRHRLPAEKIREVFC
jgi:hypothetical protein